MAWTETCRIHAVETINQTVREKSLSVNRAIKEVSQEAEIPAATLKRWYYPGKGVGSKMSQSKKANTQREKKKSFSGNGVQPGVKETADETTGDVITMTQAIKTYVQCLHNATEEEYPGKPVAAMSWGILMLARQLAKCGKLSTDDVEEALKLLKPGVGILERIANEGIDYPNGEEGGLPFVCLLDEALEVSRAICSNQINSDSGDEAQPSTEYLVEMERGLRHTSDPESYRPHASVPRCVGNYGANDHCVMCSSETMCMSMSDVQPCRNVEPLIWTPKN